MATKLRNFSTHAATKALAWVLAICGFTLAAAAVNLAVGQRYLPEMLVNDQYLTTDYFYQDINQVSWRLYETYYLQDNDTHTYYYEDERYIPKLDYALTWEGGGVASRQELTPESVSSLGGRWVALRDGKLTYSDEYMAELGAFLLPRSFASYTSENISVALRLNDEWLTESSLAWAQGSAKLAPLFWTGLSCLLACLICVIYLTVVTGRRPGDQAVHHGWLDRFYSELLFGLFCGLVAVFFASGLTILDETYYLNSISRAGYQSMDARFMLTLMCAMSAIVFPCALAVFLAMARKLKDNRFLKDCLVYRVSGRVWRVVKRALFLVKDFFQSLVDGRRYDHYPFAKCLFMRQLTYILLSAALVFFSFIFLFAAGPLALLPVVLEVMLTYWFIKANSGLYEDMGKVIDQIEHISAGDLTYRPDIYPGSPFYLPGEQLADLGGGLQKSLEKQIKTERMKIELVTNVSHDLKTPLTSIIGYIDLLSKDEGLSPEARDYVNILSRKADRLKNIVSDLFVLAKSTSGNLDLELELLDFRRLTEQTLADMGDKIDASPLTFRVKLCEQPLFIQADGRRLYRVMQNVVDNALKYSLAGSRVYISLDETPTTAILTVKNTAGYEMDFSADEILERFTRGDKARTSEGSGLGLSIAQSFTQACGGRMSVAIDGDQFKVTLLFDKRQPPTDEPAGPDAAPQDNAPPIVELGQPPAEPVGEAYQPVDYTARPSASFELPEIIDAPDKLEPEE